MSANKPLVSVITPAYNRAKFLDETIKSVLTQDYPNIEYIVLDDGSTDDTPQLLAKYALLLKSVRHTNMGEALTVNKGFRMAHGAYIIIVNSDDTILPNCISRLVEFMEARPDILVAYSDWNAIDEHSKFLYNIKSWDYNYVEFVKKSGCHVSVGALIRKKCLELTSGRDPSYRYTGDWEYWLRLGLYGEFAHLPETLATHRDHQGSLGASNGTVRGLEHIRMIKAFYSRTDLPQSIRKIRNQVIAATYREAIMCKDSRVDIPWYIQAVINYPPIVFYRPLDYVAAIVYKLPVSIQQIIKRYYHGKTEGK